MKKKGKLKLIAILGIILIGAVYYLSLIHI